MSDILTALDNLYLQLETPTTPMHVGGLLVFDGNGAGPEEQFETMLAAPVGAEPFDRRLARGRFGLPRWEQVSHVDLAEHVTVHDAPGPGGDEQLMTLVSELHTIPISRQRPLWECRLIRGLSHDRFALFFKIHHSCLDGVSGIRRIQRALSARPEEETPPVWAVEKRRGPRPASWAPRPSMMSALRGKALMVPELARAMASVGLGAARRDHHRTAPPYLCPNTPLNPMVSGERSVAWHSLPLAGVKATGAAARATVNDVALAICSAVVRERLLEMNALPDRPLVAMVPFSLHREGSAGGNETSCILCNLATHVADPVERLRIVSASAADGKKMLRAMSPDAAATYWMALGFPAILAQMAGLSARAPLPFNVVVSNVPGPTESLYHNGAQLQAIYPASLLFERQALNITLISYRDRIDFGLLACRRTIPDLPRMAQRIGAAYDELASALLPPAARR